MCPKSVTFRVCFWHSAKNDVILLFANVPLCFTFALWNFTSANIRHFVCITKLFHTKLRVVTENNFYSIDYERYRYKRNTGKIGCFARNTCRNGRCTPMYTIVHEKAPTISRGALFPQCNFEGFATMLCKGSEEFIKSSLYPQESSLSN